MADSRRRGRPPNLSIPETLILGVPKHHHDYMALLAHRGQLGVTIAEVATQILVRELDALERGGYHNLEVAPAPTKPPVKPR